MDTTLFVTFITGGSLVASLATGLLKSELDVLEARWGSLATQALLLFISIAIAGVSTASVLLPANWLMTAGSIFTGAMIIYEVLYKAVWQQAIQGKV